MYSAVGVEVRLFQDLRRHLRVSGNPILGCHLHYAGFNHVETFLCKTCASLLGEHISDS